jgi:hypothetical protein
VTINLRLNRDGSLAGLRVGFVFAIVDHPCLRGKERTGCAAMENGLSAKRAAGAPRVGNACPISPTHHGEVNAPRRDGTKKYRARP